MKYRKLAKYKYQLIGGPVTVRIYHYIPNVDIYWVKVEDGYVTVKDLYCWDGASCAIDTRSFMIASLVHDALYQLIRLQYIDVAYRAAADKILKDLCLLYGMPGWRASYVYRAVRIFGGKHCNIGKEQDKIYEIKEIAA